MKITNSQLQDVIREAIQNGFFEDITEDFLNEDAEVNSLLLAFLKELKKKKVIRGKKLKMRIVCPKNKKYVPSQKRCVVKSAGEKVKKRRAMKRAAMKKRGKMAKIVRKRKKSMRKRRSMGLR